MSRYFSKYIEDFCRSRWLTPVACLLFFWAPQSHADDATASEALIEQIEIMLAMEDGVKIWGCLSRPANVGANEKLPAVLKLDPYRGKCNEERVRGAYFAAHGYVAAYFHIRGTGLSEGKFPDREYSDAELQDAEYLIDWLSRQPWSSGAVGMYGSSWSGFNALQVAIRRPPALKAIIPYVATENIYHEGERFTDGIYHYDSWSVTADSLITTPDPADPLEETMLRNRFDQTPWSLVYLKQPRDDKFWRPDIRVDVSPDRLQVPTMMIGGWYDGYRNAILRTLTHARAPTRAIVGPWDHGYGHPRPTADLNREALRWWDHWLKGEATGVMEDPQLIAYMRRSHQPSPGLNAVPGEWRAIEKWPPADHKTYRLYLQQDRKLSVAASKPASHELRYIPSGGIEAGAWWGDLMPEQRQADAYSLVYESGPLDEELHMLGGPHATLFASASAPHANWFVRLSDVAPDGTVTMVTAGAQNGTHRKSSAKPQPLIPGEIYELSIPLQFTGWVFEPGHRIRLAVSNALWPMSWPTPYPMSTRLEVGADHASSLSLPLLPPVSLTDSSKVAAAIGSVNLSHTEADLYPATEAPTYWSGPTKVIRDVLRAETTVIEDSDPERKVEYWVADDRPAEASITGTGSVMREIDGQQLEWLGRTKIRSDEQNFYYRHDRQLLLEGEVIRERTWEETVPRDFQ